MTKQSLSARNRLRNLLRLLAGVYPEEVEGLAMMDCRALQARNDDVNRSIVFVLVKAIAFPGVFQGVSHNA